MGLPLSRPSIAHERTTRLGTQPTLFLKQRRKEKAYMRRIGTPAYITSLLAIFAMLLVACGSSGSTTTTGSGSTPTAPKAKVALVTDIGGLNDNGFNHLAYTGYKKAETQYGFAEKIIQTQSQNDYVKILPRRLSQPTWSLP